MKSARHFSREGEEKEDGGSMKGRRELQGEKHKKEVALLLSGWLCGRFTGAGGACSVRELPTWNQVLEISWKFWSCELSVGIVYV